MYLIACESWELLGGHGGSAATAAWDQAAMIEATRLEGEGCSCLMLDIQKCFDQLPREHIKEMLLALGAPDRLVQGWWSFVQGLSVHNQLATGVGKAYSRGCSIPQGCALSMMPLAKFDDTTSQAS